MRKILLLLPIGLLAALPIAAISSGSSSRCSAAALSPLGEYPEHALSPAESLKAFDSVFLGEVLVPVRKCSLGNCAGLRVIDPVKGRLAVGINVLLRLPEGALLNDSCKNGLFAEKGRRWMIFANQGTSPGGQKYLDVGQEGPSFLTQDLPDFAKLEVQYRLQRAQLDQAIDRRLGKLR